MGWWWGWCECGGVHCTLRRRRQMCIGDGARGRTRLRFHVKAGRSVSVQAFIRAWLADMKIPNAVRVSVDIDPYSFM